MEDEYWRAVTEGITTNGKKRHYEQDEQLKIVSFKENSSENYRLDKVSEKLMSALESNTRSWCDGRKILDLHGMIVQEAFEEFIGFIERSYASEQRWLLVVTGYGKNSTGGGTIKRELPDWVLNPRIENLVLRITGASRAHGGEGAYYIDLRRKKKFGSK